MSIKLHKVIHCFDSLIILLYEHPFTIYCETHRWPDLNVIDVYQPPHKRQQYFSYILVVIRQQYFSYIVAVIRQQYFSYRILRSIGRWGR
jgi:hypothetical protein